MARIRQLIFGVSEVSVEFLEHAVRLLYIGWLEYSHLCVHSMTSAVSTPTCTDLISSSYCLCCLVYSHLVHVKLNLCLKCQDPLQMSCSLALWSSLLISTRLCKFYPFEVLISKLCLSDRTSLNYGPETAFPQGVHKVYLICFSSFRGCLLANI